MAGAFVGAAGLRQGTNLSKACLVALLIIYKHAHDTIDRSTVDSRSRTLFGAYRAVVMCVRDRTLIYGGTQYVDYIHTVTPPSKAALLYYALPDDP